MQLPGLNKQQLQALDAVLSEDGVVDVGRQNETVKRIKRKRRRQINY